MTLRDKSQLLYSFKLYDMHFELRYDKAALSYVVWSKTAKRGKWRITPAYTAPRQWTYHFESLEEGKDAFFDRIGHLIVDDVKAAESRENKRKAGEACGA